MANRKFTSSIANIPALLLESKPGHSGVLFDLIDSNGISVFSIADDGEVVINGGVPSDVVLADGSVPLTANWDVGGFALSNVTTLGTTGAITAAPDADTTHTFGRARLHSAVADSMFLSHYDHATVSGSAVRQLGSDGSVFLNAPTGGALYARFDNGSDSGWQLDNTGIGFFTAPSYKFHVAATGTANAITMDGTTGFVAMGAAPASDKVLYAVTAAASTYGVYGQSTNYIGVRGNSTSNIAVYGTSTSSYGVYGSSVSFFGGYFQSLSGIGLRGYQTGALTANTVNYAIHAYRNLTLGAFDATGAVMRVEDATASSGLLAEWVKEGATVASLSNTGDFILSNPSPTGNSRLAFYQSTIERAFIEFQNASAIVIDSDWGIKLQPNNTLALDLDTSGRVGIGGAAVSGHVLHVSSTSGDDVWVDATSGLLTANEGLIIPPGKKISLNNDASQYFIGDTLSNGFKISTRSSLAFEMTAPTGLYTFTGGHLLVGTTTDATGQVQLTQSSVTGAKPVIALEQKDLSEAFIRFIGESTTDASQSIIDVVDMSTPGALTGWLKIYVKDDAASGAISDSFYYIPFYLAPTA